MRVISGGEVKDIVVITSVESGVFNTLNGEGDTVYEGIGWQCGEEDGFGRCGVTAAIVVEVVAAAAADGDVETEARIEVVAAVAAVECVVAVAAVEGVIGSTADESVVAGVAVENGPLCVVSSGKV